MLSQLLSRSKTALLWQSGFFKRMYFSYSITMRRSPDSMR